MAFYCRPFESVKVCLNRACTALVILNFMELLHLFMTNKGIYTKIIHRRITNGKATFARFTVSTDVHCKSLEQGILVVLSFAVLYD